MQVKFMFANEKRNLVAPLAVLAAILMVCVAFVGFMGMSEAKTFDDGDADTGDLTPTVVNIAPGFIYDYTISFATSLNMGTEVTILVNDFATQSIEINAELTKTADSADDATWGTLSLEIPTTCTAGDYDLVLKAVHAESGQTAYQYIQFHVSQGVTITPTELSFDKSIQNDEITQTFTVASGFGNFTEITVAASGFTLTSEQPNANGQNSVEVTVTGTPTEIGAKTITISGSTYNGETFEYEFPFTVYSEFEGSYEGQTITAIDGNAASSTQQTVPSDLNVTWAITAGQTEGVTIDSSTGVITVDSDNYINQTVTATATDSITSQTKTIDVLVQNEPVGVALQIGEDQYLIDGTFYTYVSAGARTLTVSPNLVADSTFSGIASWDVSGDDSVVTIDNGTVNITAPASAAASTEYTVTAVTEFGKSVTATFNLIVEGQLSASGDNSTTVALNGNDTTKTRTVSASAENATLAYSVAPSDDALQVSMVSGNTEVQFISSTFDQDYTATMTVTTLGGQSAEVTFNIHTYPVLSFSEPPEAGSWFGAGNE